MPSDFVSGRRGQPKTLADLIGQLSSGSRKQRDDMSTSPVSGPLKHKKYVTKSVTNKETEEKRRSRLARQVLKELDRG